VGVKQSDCEGGGNNRPTRRKSHLIEDQTVTAQGGSKRAQAKPKQKHRPAPGTDLLQQLMLCDHGAKP